MTVPRRARLSFIAAGVGVLALALTWFASHEVARLRQVDVNILLGFLSLSRARVVPVASVFVGLCDASQYVVLAAVPIVIALLRGRRRVAVAVFLLLLAANGSTELLKPLTAGPRDPVTAPGVMLTHATWPSGHTTAALSLALAMIICVPARLRPIVSGIMALFVIGVVYSLLALGAHYPSDIVGGFEMASTWTALALGVLWTAEARRPTLAVRLPDVRARFSVAEALLPALLALLGALALAAVNLATRPRATLGFAGSHLAFVTAVCGLAVLSFGCATALSLALRRPSPVPRGTGPAPTAVRGRRLRRSLRG